MANNNEISQAENSLHALFCIPLNATDSNGSFFRIQRHYYHQAIHRFVFSSCIIIQQCGLIQSSGYFYVLF